MTEPAFSLDAISDALSQRQFVFYYQPKISMISGNLVGAEALIRWQADDGRIIMPRDFIPLSERHGLINQITRVMFTQLLEHMAAFDCKLEECVFSMNASAKDFLNGDFVDDIAAAIEADKLKPHMFEIELTETSIANHQEIYKQLARLRELGVGLAMDDYGTGYASLDTLAKSHFTAIKIDKSIVHQISKQAKGKELVESSLRLGYQLGMDVVAEGIESHRLYTSLQHLGCTIAQGFWVAKPMPFNEFTQFAKAQKQWGGSSIGIIYLAQQEHLHWRKQVTDYVFLNIRDDIEDHDCGFKNVPTLDHRYCGLGRWYYGKIGGKMNHSATFQSLGHIHKQLHDLGAQLIQKTDEKTDRHQVESRYHDFIIHSNMVMTLLQQLENECISSEGID